ncbi:hypothetical protein [Pseudomonas nunensis]|uniref:Phage infection protein n=1 Tax=Pseudomonas nunensis TaxID=2961896 RepID=A0ABY5ERD9_9PSED|nr:hypothetical protein [Pseudomonas nunensis]KPN90598.1 hypothetical protein AL066_09740 [Pseudomonas nunensis]MCL5225386.1 hypothetical protein [Pseudomonas nunensis]UTO16852.1 hypothetical protein NK667_11050 [Pseudomonas nunensis]
MFNFSKVSSLVLGLALIGGLGLSNLASANTLSAAAHRSAQQLLVEGGSDRLQQNRVAEYGSENLQKNRVAEGGSDRLIQNRVAEGGADRLQELRERVALFSPGNAAHSGVVVAENRPEFGSKYQRY